MIVAETVWTPVNTVLVVAIMPIEVTEETGLVKEPPATAFVICRVPSEKVIPPDPVITTSDVILTEEVEVMLPMEVRLATVTE